MSLADRLGAWIRAHRPQSLREILPPGDAPARLLSAPSSYLLCLTLAMTLVGKASMAAEIHGHPTSFLLAWGMLADCTVCLGLAGIFALLESKSRWFAALSVPISALIAVFGALNAGYLVVGGEQGSYEAVYDLYARHKEALMVLEEQLALPRNLALGGLVILAATSLPIGIFALARRYARPRDRRGRALARGHLALPLAGLAAIASAVAPAPSSVEGRMVGRNALATTLRTSVTRVRGGDFEGWTPPEIVDEAELRRFAARGRARPNLLVVILESTRFDHSSLAGESALAGTPALAALAERGLVATRARAVLPHTTKSMFSIFCGRLPTMQKGVIELSAGAAPQCLPRLLGEAGYRTAFLQSSFGTFEQRPRLVAELGFEHFAAWEDLQGQKLGYLASDDLSLVEPFGEWLGGLAEGEPFMATILTSATHHPYRLTREALSRARASKRGYVRDQQRYARLVEEADRMLDGLLEQLRRHGREQDTIVVVVGDHGEGFGDHGVRQHDNNFYEEGLHVPLVVAGPGVPHQEVSANVSLVDLLPTLLPLLGIEASSPAPLQGYDLLAADFPTDEPRWFGCFADLRCRGFVLGDAKVVYVPQTDELWYFDLASDPEEREPKVLTRELERLRGRLDHELDARRTKTFEMQYEANERFPPWRCEAGSRVCTHPRAEKAADRGGRSPPGGK